VVVDGANITLDKLQSFKCREFRPLIAYFSLKGNRNSFIRYTFAAIETQPIIKYSAYVDRIYIFAS
jgi:hypothetical protein